MFNRPNTRGTATHIKLPQSGWQSYSKDRRMAYLTPFIQTGSPVRFTLVAEALRDFAAFGEHYLPQWHTVIIERVATVEHQKQRPAIIVKEHDGRTGRYTLAWDDIYDLQLAPTTSPDQPAMTRPMPAVAADATPYHLCPVCGSHLLVQLYDGRE